MTGRSAGAYSVAAKPEAVFTDSKTEIAAGPVAVTKCKVIGIPKEQTGGYYTKASGGYIYYYAKKNHLGSTRALCYQNTTELAPAQTTDYSISDYCYSAQAPTTTVIFLAESISKICDMSAVNFSMRHCRI